MFKVDREIFEHYDVNKDGFIDRREAERYLRALCPSDTSSIDSMIKEFFQRYDSDQDGRLNFHEFRRWLQEE